MWLSKRFGNVDSAAAETGTVAIGGSSTVKTASTVQAERVHNYAPYGYSSYAPKGENILIINSSGGSVGAGTRMKDESLLEGEISIKSESGAKILLKNDGTVEINGLVITAKGTIADSPEGVNE